MPFDGKENLIILPTYNERRKLKVLWLSLTFYQNAYFNVDDNSPDGTGRLAEAMATGDTRIFVLHRTKNRGLGPAYIDGFRWAIKRKYHSVFEMDADFSHQPKHLPQFLAKLEHADIVLGCRYMPEGGVEGWAQHRQWLSKAGNFYAKGLLQLSYRDLTGGFKCFRRTA